MISLLIVVALFVGATAFWDIVSKILAAIAEGIDDLFPRKPYDG